MLNLQQLLKQLHIKIDDLRPLQQSTRINIPCEEEKKQSKCIIEPTRLQFHKTLHTRELYVKPSYQTSVGLIRKLSFKAYS